MNRFEVVKMIFRFFLTPACICNKSFDELVFTCKKVHHSAVVVTDERNVMYAADSNRIAYPEFRVAEICSTSSDYVCEVFRNVQMLAVVHAHTDEHLR